MFFQEFEGPREVVDVEWVARETGAEFGFPFGDELVGVLRAVFEGGEEGLGVLAVLSGGFQLASPRGEVHRNVGRDFPSELFGFLGGDLASEDHTVEEGLFRFEFGFRFGAFLAAGEEERVAVSVNGLFAFHSGARGQLFAELFAEFWVPATVEKGLDRGAPDFFHVPEDLGDLFHRGGHGDRKFEAEDFVDIDAGCSGGIFLGFFRHNVV